MSDPILDEIDALGAQAWMTGTDAELFSALGDRALHLAVREADGASALVLATGRLVFGDCWRRLRCNLDARGSRIDRSAHIGF